MRLKEIKIFGFKSFGKKTAFVLHPALNGLVGPNGCGKSNLVDAIRWVLGESYTKNLRASETTDVIFMGTSQLPPSNYAEVSLVFDLGTKPTTNHGRFLTLTRRIYRDEQREYLLNGLPCRWKDIKQTLSEYGFLSHQFTIIEQERRDAIIKADPLILRSMIEECAGIQFYRDKKKEILKTLEQAQNQIQQFFEIHDEMLQRRAELKKQMDIWIQKQQLSEQYQTLTQTHRAYKIYLKRQTHNQLLDEKQKILDLQNTLSQEIQTLSIQESQLSLSIQTLQDQLKTTENNFTQKETLLQFKQQQLHQIQQHIQEEHNRLDLFVHKIQNLEQDIHHPQKDLEKKQRYQQLQTESKRYKQTLLHIENQIHSFNEEQQLLQQNISHIEKQIWQIQQQAQQEKFAIQTYQQKQKQKEEQNQKRLVQQSLISKKIQQAENEKYVLSLDLKEHQQALERLYEQFQLIQPHIQSQKSSIEQGQKALEEISSQLIQYQTESHFLNAQIEHTSFQNLEKWEDFLQDHGLISLEASLDLSDPVIHSWLNRFHWFRHAVWVIDEKHAFSVLKSAQEKGLTLTCLVQSWCEQLDPAPVSLGQHPHLERACRGFLGSFSDHIKDNHNQNRLTWIVYDQSWLGHPGLGWMTSEPLLGVNEKETAWEKLDRLKELNVKIENLLGQKHALQATHIQKEKEFEHVNSTLKDLEKQIVEKVKDTKQIQERIEWLNHQITDWKKDLEIYDEALEDETEEIHIQVHEQQYDSLMDKIKELESKKQDLLLQYEELSEKKEEFEITKSDCLQTYTSAQSEFNHLEQFFQNYDVRRQEWMEQLKMLKALQEEGLKKIQDYQETIRNLEEESIEDLKYLKNLQESLSQLNEEYLKNQKNLQNVQKTLKTKEQAYAQNKTKEEILNEKLFILTEEVRILYDDWKKSGGDSLLDPAPPVSDALIQELEQQKDELEKQILSIGPVNERAKIDYEQINTKIDFLLKQISDVQNSIEMLEKSLSHLEQNARERFEQTFKQLNEIFFHLFQILFPGGQAYLSLSGEHYQDDVHVSIHVELPGKKPKNIQLFSGGERSLIATSLLFALLKCSPSPFCVLDEVDAPLDESNLLKFRSLLKELSADFQFLVISHNRKTMEVMDALYGITMNQPGLSHVVSARLEDVKPYFSQNTIVEKAF